MNSSTSAVGATPTDVASPIEPSTSSSRRRLGRHDRPPRVSEGDVIVAAKDLCFSYGETVILERIDLEVRAGEIVALIGPSGCGKSTLLNLVAGILRPSSGVLESAGEPIVGLNRRVTYMTQRDTLLAWRNALDNAALPLEIKGVPKKERYEAARRELRRVGVDHAEQRRPHELSGGMRSRLSLARALLSESDVFLMDEPFAAIDAILRVKLQQLLIDVWESTHKTIMYVTHDLNEAIALGHRVIVMGAGPGRIAVERDIPMPQPRDVAKIRATPEAQELYAELWKALEAQIEQMRA